MFVKFEQRLINLGHVDHLDVAEVAPGQWLVRAHIVGTSSVTYFTHPDAHASQAVAEVALAKLVAGTY